MHRKPLQIIVLLIFTFLVLAFTDDKPQINFTETNFKSALNASRKQHKPLFIYIGTEHCDECFKMKAVFKDSAVAAYYNANYVCLKMDPDNFSNNMRLTDWGIYQTPSFVYMNNRKYIYYSMSGAQTAKDLLNAGIKVMKNIKEF